MPHSLNKQSCIAIHKTNYNLTYVLVEEYVFHLPVDGYLKWGWKACYLIYHTILKSLIFEEERDLYRGSEKYKYTDGQQKMFAGTIEIIEKQINPNLS